jgi:hypothetical protein
MSDWLRPALVVDPRILGVHAGEYVKPAVKFILMRGANLHHHHQDSATNVLSRNVFSRIGMCNPPLSLRFPPSCCRSRSLQRLIDTALKLPVEW